MQVRLLGSVEVVVGGAVRPVPGLRRKAVLAMLGLHPGQIVSSDRLIDAVWADDAPATALNTLQRHISYLRDLLGAKDTITARASGYQLDLGEEATDVLAAERLIRAGRQAADPQRTAACLPEAVALDLFAGLGDCGGQAGTSDSLGYIHHHLGNHELAIAHYLRALELYRGHDDRYYEADTLDLDDAVALAARPVARQRGGRRAGDGQRGAHRERGDHQPSHHALLCRVVPGHDGGGER
ncbi:winged helix-turn-helix domain-containing protein [Catellatospora sp. NPDC049133]|uniref:winged helix-turn-helix domain-containing protein n=1 Tax=Catellatospora sp. NPDC049133 TaxID=3155499 RepID=UPI0033D01675